MVLRCANAHIRISRDAVRLVTWAERSGPQFYSVCRRYKKNAGYIEAHNTLQQNGRSFAVPAKHTYISKAPTAYFLTYTK